MKKILSLFAIFLTLMACSKEEYKEAVNYELPSILMDSCVVSSSNSFTAYMTVDKGESFSNHSLQLLVYDAKDLSNALSTTNVELGEDRVQKVQKTFNVPATDNEYLVSAVLKTEKNSFKSRSLMVSLSKMTTESYLRLWGQPRYVENSGHEAGDPSKYATEDIALHFSTRRRFGIIVKAAMKGQPVEVRVGNHIIPINLEDWSGTVNLDNEKDVVFEVNMPDDIEPGTYDVALHWPDAELPMLKKIRILPLKAEEEATPSFSEFADQPYGARASFRIGDKMYYYTQVPSILVSCDLNTKEWTRLNDVPYDNIRELVSIGSKAYGIIESVVYHDDNIHYSIQNELCEYDSNTDKWRKLADIPVEGGVLNRKMFAAGGNVFICGGILPNTNIDCMEIWKYEISKGKWTRVADSPTEEPVLKTGNGDTNGYFITQNGHLWVYNSSKNEWNREARLMPVYYSYTNQYCLLEYNDKLFLVGHKNNSSIYSYDFKTKNWELQGIYNFNSSSLAYNLTSTFHKENLILGPMLEDPGSPFVTNMTFLNFDLKWIQNQ